MFDFRSESEIKADRTLSSSYFSYSNGGNDISFTMYYGNFIEMVYTEGEKVTTGYVSTIAESIVCNISCLLSFSYKLYHPLPSTTCFPHSCYPSQLRLLVLGWIYRRYLFPHLHHPRYLLWTHLSRSWLEGGRRRKYQLYVIAKLSLRSCNSQINKSSQYRWGISFSLDSYLT